MNSLVRRTIASLVFVLSSIHFMVSSASAQCAGTWTQRMPTPPVPAQLTGYAMAFDSARSVTVLFGPDGKTWEWNGTTWSMRSPATTPPARDSFAMAYDSKRGVTVLFGGESGGVIDYQDTWEWDGTNWSQKFPVHAPGTKQGHAMVYDSARGVTVLFGGVPNADETWEWNGTDWNQRTSTPRPGARTSHAMAYDSNRGVTVLFGGFLVLSSTEDDETWEWDGTNWSQRSPTTKPLHRYLHAMAYDSARNVTVLFGGSASGNPNAETWEWNGTNWAVRVPAVPPSPRYVFPMAYDSARRVTVLFGGFTNAGNNDETWEWAGPGPFITQQPVPQTLGVGETASFSIVAAGDGSPTYRWRRNSSPLTDGGAISGSATPALTINAVAAADAGDYTCLVSNSCVQVLSHTASLVVDVCKALDATGDCNGNGVRDSCEIAADPSLDANNNGVLDSCEAPPPTAQGQSAPCGPCGAGAAAMIPLGLIGLFGLRRRRA